jgi:hypothetical protein
VPSTNPQSMGKVVTRTATGSGKARLFQGILLEVEGREGIFDCLELPDGVDPLLG